MAFNNTTPSNGDKETKGNRTFIYSSSTNSWDICEDGAAINVAPTWRYIENGDDLEIQKYIAGTGWISKGNFGGTEAGVQPPEVDNSPSIFAPDMVVLSFSDPSVSQNVEGCSVDDEDSISLIMEVTVTNGALDMPLLMTYEEIGGGIRLTGTITELNTELAGLEFLPTNLAGPEPQNGTIDILLNDQDGGTANATHTITVEVLDFGR